MKKLLLILICLFVSFEVKSENDDLSGKKLVCDSPFFITGFEFLDITKVKKISINKRKGTIKTTTSKYSTTPVNITIGSYSIDRLTLKLIGISDCKLIEDNLDSYMDDKLEIIVNEIKSKQKI